MSDWKEYSAKTVDEALTNALLDLNTTSDQIEYEVVEKESGGLLGVTVFKFSSILFLFVIINRKISVFCTILHFEM